jgi:hypothetical protein
MFKTYNNTYTSPHTHLFCKTFHVNILFKGMLGNVNSKYCKVYILKTKSAFFLLQWKNTYSTLLEPLFLIKLKLS